MLGAEAMNKHLMADRTTMTVYEGAVDAIEFVWARNDWGVFEAEDCIQAEQSIFSNADCNSQ
jgi:hypothetical protein